VHRFTVHRVREKREGEITMAEYQLYCSRP
jgi:hypothetical protein